MANDGFNPFRDTHGRFADQPGLGGGSRETLSAPLPSKTEWSKDGVSVEFTGGRTPAYEVRHAGQVIATVQATAKWRQDLMTAQLKAEEHLVKLQTESANQMLRAQAGYAPPAASIETVRAAVAVAKPTVEGYTAVGQEVMRLVHSDPKVGALKARHEELEATKRTTPVERWTVELMKESNQTRQNLAHAIREQAGEVVERIRPMARRSDLDVDPVSLERGLDLADEMIEFFPKAWVEAASRRGTMYIDSTPQSRSYYSAGYRAIFLSESAGRKSMVHELGHHMENNNNRLRWAAQDYLNYRTTGEPTISMRQVLGRSYGDDEYTKADKFRSAYMGKQYSTGSTEIISMMLEEWTEGNYGVTLDDPDMFSWFAGVMATV